MGTIIGVVKDFHFASMRQKIEPAVFYYNPRNYDKLYVKTTGKDAPKAIAALSSQWKKYNADFSFEYNFLDEAYNNLYKSEAEDRVVAEHFCCNCNIHFLFGVIGSCYLYSAGTYP